MTTNKGKIIALYAAKYAGLFALARWMNRGRLRILGYHGFEILDEGIVNPLLFMRDETFSQRLDWLRNNNFDVISLNEGLAGLSCGKLPTAPVVITLDDGWYSIFSKALPLLKKHALPATVYISTYHMSKQTQVFNIALQYATMKNPKAATTVIQENLPSHQEEQILGQIFEKSGIDYDEIWRARIFRYMNDNEVEQLAASGIDAQMHTHRHRISDDPNMIAAEIDDNRQSLLTCVDQKLVHFCYPSGVYSDRIADELRTHGIESAVTCDTGLNDKYTNHMKLKRFIDGDSIPMIVFEAEMCGILDILRRIRRAIRV